MNPFRILGKILPGRKGRKLRGRNKVLLDQHERGLVLQVDNNIDNKGYLNKRLRNGK